MSMRVVEKNLRLLPATFPSASALKLAVIGWSDGTTSYLGQDTERQNGEVHKVALHVERTGLFTVPVNAVCCCCVQGLTANDSLCRLLILFDSILLSFILLHFALS